MASEFKPPAEQSERDEAALALAAMRQATIFVGLLDPALRPSYLNAAGRRMIGLSDAADITRYELADFFVARQHQVIRSVVLPALLLDGHWEGELCLCHVSQASRETAVHWSAFRLVDDEGALLGAASFTTDITALKDAERGLRDQQALLVSLLDNLPLGVGVYDHEGVLIHANHRLRDYTGLTRLPSGEPAAARRWRGFDADGRAIPPELYPGARALRGESVMPGIDFRYDGPGGAERWMRVSAVPFRGEADGADQAIVVVQDIDDLKRATERIEVASAALARQSRFLEATLSSIPDYVYAFDRERRFVYANPVMLGLFGLSADEMLGRTFADLDYPADLAARLNGHIDQILNGAPPIEDEVFFRSPTGQAAYFSFLWGPVYDAEGSIELVVGVSRDTTERRRIEQELRRSEARLRAATELAGLGIYSWDPVTGALEWDERLRAMWGLPAGSKATLEEFEAGIHPADLPRVQRAIAACVDPSGNGRYNVEYRVVARDDGVTHHIATSGQTAFAGGRAVGFIGAAIDVTAQRRIEAAVRVSEAQFRSFAEHSSNLIWIGDPMKGEIIYRSAAYEKIWGLPCPEGPQAVSEWMKDVHPDDRKQVEHALALVKAGEVTQFEYRIIRSQDGGVRLLRDTSFPIPDEYGQVTRIGGITEDLTREDVRQVYVVSARAPEARRLAAVVRELGYRARIFDSVSAFLDVAPVLAPGCVLVDLRKRLDEGLSIPRELKARSITLKTIAIDVPGADVDAAIAAMKAGVVDYLMLADDASFRVKLANAIAECHGAVRPAMSDEKASARVARLTPREREVLIGLVDGGTNKSIGQKLGISPRTVELHRAQVMSRLNASSLTELLQTALAAGITPSAGTDNDARKAT